MKVSHDCHSEVFYALYGKLVYWRQVLEFTYIKRDNGKEQILPGNHMSDAVDDKTVSVCAVYEFGDGDAYLREPTEEEMEIIKAEFDDVQSVSYEAECFTNRKEIEL